MTAEEKSAMATLSRGLNKRVGRTKEIVLQTMGKVDKTEDGTFDFYVSNFSRQQTNATKLQKYMGNYISAVRSVVHASIAFQDALKEVYEDEWAGKFDLINNLDGIKSASQQYLMELDKSSTALYSYQAQFPDMRAKIDKRNRKLVDYDATRHTIEQLKSSKKKDESKLMKAEEKNADAKRLYEHLNGELHDTLPALFDSRVVSYGAMLQSLFLAESTYHGELSKNNAGLNDVIDKLVAERGSGSNHSAYTSKRGSTTGSIRVNGSLPPTPTPAAATTPLFNGVVEAEVAPAPAAEAPAVVEIPVADPVPVTPEPVPEPASAPEPVAAAPEPTPVVEVKAEEPVAAAEEPAPAAAAAADPEPAAAAPAQEDSIYVVPPNNKAAAKAEASFNELPFGVLKKVQATHPYTGEDEDELTFSTNDVFCVLPYEDPEEAERRKEKKIIIPVQDDGWYYGFLESKPDVKGVFPANFTRPL